ncbi:Cytochrome P450 [Corchorus olitorius]|uniref:Cytochrome P450 n=1 Tax=Corchorus olitorius TaxID=93759 RepID=A0A1R3HIG8_9ROSI|nr:Cytochrome P450 [Corchorus olitorius]
MFDLKDYIIVFLIWLITIIFLRAILRTRRGKPHLPPHPPALPIVGHMRLLPPILHQSLAKLSNRYGPLPKLANLDFITYGTADMAMAPYGPLWKFMRILCMSQLLGNRALDRLHPLRREEMKRLVKILQEKSEVGEAVDIGVELKMKNAEMKFTIDNIKALVSNILIGGIDSFPLMIGWGLAELINHPEVMKKAQKEIDSVVGRNTILEESDIENLPNLKAIDPKQWENPLESKPERFLSKEWRQGKQQFLDLRGHNFSLCCHLGVEEEAALELHWHLQLSQQCLG